MPFFCHTQPIRRCGPGAHRFAALRLYLVKCRRHRRFMQGRAIIKRTSSARRPLLVATSCLIVILAEATSAWADTPSEFGPTRALHDAGAYVTAPLRWDPADWAYFGGALVAIGAAHQFDRRVRSHFTAGSATALNGKDTHALQDALPAAALVMATGAYAALIDDHSGFEETWSM